MIKRYLFVFFTALILGGILCYFIIPQKVMLRHQIEEKKIIYIDTLIRTLPAKPIYIKRTAEKIIKLRDTIIQTNPFCSAIDTIIAFDTVHAEYEFPENIFTIEVKKKPDTMKIQTISIMQTVKEETPWWQTPVYIIGGALGGYVLGIKVR
ncbi:MAG: hypothetical protein HW421_3793 [Ignavibacteria bacterium]|nr:hypothetical protein [Ignavibacteria bacterium]